MITNIRAFCEHLEAVERKQLKQGIKALNQLERSLIRFCLFKFKDDPAFSLSEIRLEQANTIMRKIRKATPSEQKSNLFQRIWKGFLNRIGMRIGSHDLVDKINGKRLTQYRMEKALKLLKDYREENPDEKIKLSEFLKTHGYALKFKNINLAIKDVTVFPQARLPFGRVPSWGSEILRDIDLSDITFQDCTFNWVNFSGSNLENVTFENCAFKDTVNEGIAYTNCVFNKCDFSRSTFQSAQFNRCSLTECNLKDTTYYKAGINGTSFEKCDLSRAIFFESDVENDSSIKESTLTDCYLFDKPFVIEECSENTIEKPLVGLLWSNHKQGIAGNKIYHSIIRNGGVPLRVDMDIPVDLEKLKDEVADLIEKSSDQLHESIPQKIVHLAKEEGKIEIGKLITEAKNLVSVLGGLLLPGSDSDIPPKFYGLQDKIHKETKQDLNDCRILFEFALLNEAFTKGLPYLGICRGSQVANVFLGGDVKQHVSGHQGVQWYTQDDEEIKGMFAQIFKKGHIRGFADHHQANRRISKHLSVISSYKAVPKLLEGKHGSPKLLTQFHPEFIGDDTNFLGSVLNLLLTDNNEDFFKEIIGSALSHQKKRSVLAQIIPS